MQRQIVGTLNVRALDHIKQDILEHRNDEEYDVLYLTAVPDSRHNFRVRIEDFQSLDFDNSDQWSQRLLYALYYFNQSHPRGVPFIVDQVCAALVHGAYIPSIDQRDNISTLNARAGNEYRIAVYQNAQCTGQVIPYSGDDEDCHTGLGSGGVGLQLLALDADGQIAFFDKPDCNGNLVAAFNPDQDHTGTDCKPLHGIPVSFRFENA
ncbi:uncharacterized protein N7500_005946 [Penicillium coprophilum]|uniref:uncharacterized protein n=1 Tax=Penicillium coprophilum TaxID=36646 RepID=UPI00238C29CA|nr:uncharacterized protein N7500_005946 [Penicillium coprophilum]KAJ5164116.1 hypothetical protein N7500_005946 [Penicillium coprophilum]